MKSKTISKSIAAMAIMLMLTGCFSQSRVEPVLSGGYLTLRKGQVFTARKDCVLVDLEIVEQKDAIIIDLIRSQRKQEVKQLVE